MAIRKKYKKGSDAGKIAAADKAVLTKTVYVPVYSSSDDYSSVIVFG